MLLDEALHRFWIPGRQGGWGGGGGVWDLRMVGTCLFKREHVVIYPCCHR